MNVTTERAKPKVFYGWYMVAAGVIMNTFMMGVLAKGLTTLMDPIATAFGWSYASVSLAQSLRGVETGVLNPIMGKIVDRFPAKWLILIGTVILGAGYLCLSQVNSIVMLYASFMIMALGSSLGASMAPTASIARWFRKDLGKASGAIAMGIGLGGFAVPILVALIDTFDWRTATIVVAVAVWATGIPLSFVFRSRPEDYGMLPDGRAPLSAKLSGGKTKEEMDVGVKEAIKQRVFWQIGIADTLQWAGYSAATIHVMPYLSRLGFDKGTAAMVAMLVPVISIPARYAFGWMTDNFANKYASAISMGLMGLGLFIFHFMSPGNWMLLILYVTIAGIGLGGLTPLRAPRVREYFGTKAFGSLFGLSHVFVTFATVGASPLAGLVYDMRGVYDPIWLIFGAAGIVAMVLMLTLPLPRPTES